MRCAILGCPSDSTKNLGADVKISFHRFPRDISLFSAWKKRCSEKINNFEISRICSLHFKEEYFREVNGKRVLDMDRAMPTLNVQTKVKERR